MTDWKALCEELADTLERAQRALRFEGGCSDTTGNKRRDLIARARAALAQQEPEVVGPTDEELLSLDQLRDTWNAQADATNSWDELGVDEIIWWAQCQALARYGHQPAPPVAGEVGELVAALRAEAVHDEINDHMAWLTPADARRAADLLEQRHPAPVPVAERLPSASHVYFEFVISDADDCTQTGGIAPTYAQALSEGQHYLAQYQQDGPHTLELRRVEVLPPGALPLHAGEVE